MSGAVIRADGMEWPLQTFLDARGFTAFDYDREELPSVATDPVRLELVLTDLTIITRPAEDVVWQDVAAWRFMEGELVQCTWCDDYVGGSEIVLHDTGMAICEYCMDSAEYDD